MRFRFNKFVAWATLVALLLVTAMAGVGYTQARASTTVGTITIRQIVSGTLNFASGTTLALASGNSVSWTGRSFMRSTANGILQIGQSSGSSPQQEINTGTAVPTVASCGTGAVTTKSTNAAGEFTTTGASACTLTFGTPAFTNKPFCVVSPQTTAEAFRISAISTTAFTVTFTTAGNTFDYVCLGGL